MITTVFEFSLAKSNMENLEETFFTTTLTALPKSGSEPRSPATWFTTPWAA
jgi:hypothetical protein